MRTPEQIAEADAKIELLKAWRDGKMLQIYCLKAWQDNSEKDAPCIGTVSMWRIKPEPLRYWVNVYPDNVNCENHSTKREADLVAGIYRIACVEMVEVSREEYPKK